MAAAVLLLLGAVSGGGHQFRQWLGKDWRMAFHPDHLRPAGWDPEVWPPGATLSVAIAESELWGIPDSDLFRSMDDVMDAVDRSLALWSDIESADIRWKIDRIAPVEELDHHRGIFVFPREIDFIFGQTEGASAFMSTRLGGFDGSGRKRDPAWIVRCGVWLTYPGERFDDLETFVAVTGRHIGHCLGLDRTFGNPHDPRAAERKGEEGPPPIWGWEGIMSHAVPRSPVPNPSLDERVAASRLRPRAGWLEETGSIWGGVFAEGEPARAVYVLASRVASGTGQVGAGVGAFTGENGTFDIRGLDPGTFVLWVLDTGTPTADGPDNVASIDGSSVGDLKYTNRLLRFVDDATTHIHDTIWKSPVVVRAGERIGPLVIPVRRAEVVE